MHRYFNDYIGESNYRYAIPFSSRSLHLAHFHICKEVGWGCWCVCMCDLDSLGPLAFVVGGKRQRLCLHGWRYCIT